jgi:tetratricopeptide (TPR) repeat protein
MRSKVYGVLLGTALAAGWLLQLRSAEAQDAACTVHTSQEARQQEARTRFQQGQQLVEAERFVEALVAYECSFQNVPHPSTLYNIARAAELAGQFRRALDAWRVYLRMNPEAEDRADVEQRIAALEGMGAGAGGGTGTGAGTGAGTGTGTGTGSGGQPSSPTMPPPAAAAAPQTWETPEGAPTDVYAPGQAGQEYQVVEHRPPSPWRYYAWYFMGTGAALALVGAYLAIPELNVGSCGGSVDDYDPLNACAVTGYAALGVGAALVVAAGLIWIFAEPGGEYVVTRRAAVAPTLAFDDSGRLVGAAASWVMRF